MAGETAKRKRAPFLALLVMLMILLHTTPCHGATFSSITMNNATSPYHGRMDEPELMFDSEISRMLANNPRPVTKGTNNAGTPAVNDCSRGKKYKTCLDEQNPGTSKGPCPVRKSNSPYNRNC